MVGREGFEPPKHYAARLQRVDLTNGRADPGREDGASRKLHAIYSVVNVHGRVATMRWLPRGSALRGDARMYWVVLRRSAENRTLSTRVLEALRLPQPHSPGLFRPVPICGFWGLPGSDWIAFAGLLITPAGGYIGMQPRA